ncbi:DUF3526 domain-containing protein [Sphingobacterium sp. ML3W]|uniref:DUF3526 domain-containing protein n=1 Tax=Sphingobacterium sp. ML3W TaxID=1538644 RepID=UPI00130DFDB3|nr:DUF3526 domain-containing protein [Sphingobacterium sp. ML3W]
MKHLITITRYEFRHFARSPFKITALLLFLGAAIYGLQNGYELFKKQLAETENIKSKNEETIAEVISWYDAGKKGPDDKPWIDVTTPMRAIWYAPASAIKEPSKMMPFSIGQAEQFGYYKQVTNWSSTFDADLSEEMANPERLAIGTLDFSFIIIYLLPVLLIILLFNIGGLEKDLNFDRLVQVNNPSFSTWLLARFIFYFFLIIALLLVLMLVYAALTNALFDLSGTFLNMYLLVLFYTFLWFAVFYYINLKGKGSANQAIKMASIWLMFAVIVPGATHQILSLKYPASYMTDYLDASRDETYKIYDLPADTVMKKLLVHYPELQATKLAKDTVMDEGIIGNSSSGLINKLMKDAAKQIEDSNESKNQFIRNTSWINPVNWFQNTMNRLSETDYYAYQKFRVEIQKMIDKKVKFILNDSWNKETIDREKFLEYVEAFKTETEK